LAVGVAAAASEAEAAETMAAALAVSAAMAEVLAAAALEEAGRKAVVSCQPLTLSTPLRIAWNELKADS
jgi:hypothetical protein